MSKIAAQRVLTEHHLSHYACKLPTVSLLSWQGAHILDGQRENTWLVETCQKLLPRQQFKQETPSQAIRSWEGAKQSMHRRMHTCASIFSSFQGVLRSASADGGRAAGLCWLPSPFGCTAAAAAGAAGPGPSADGADTAADSGFGCSLAFSARSCTSMDMTPAAGSRQPDKAMLAEETRGAEAACQMVSLACCM